MLYNNKNIIIIVISKVTEVGYIHLTLETYDVLASNSDVIFQHPILQHYRPFFNKLTIKMYVTRLLSRETLWWQ